MEPLQSVTERYGSVKEALRDVMETLQEHYGTFPCDEVSFDDEIITDKLKNLKVNKSPGPDMLHPRILYEVRHQIVTPLRIDI